MNTNDKILEDIGAFAALHGMTFSKFGMLSVKDHKLVSRLKSGKSITSSTIDKIYDFIKSHNQSSH